MEPVQSKRIAARHMLWMESLAASISMAIGIIAGFGYGPLWAALDGFKPWLGINQSTWWGVTFLAVGFVFLGATFLELKRGRHWGHVGVKRSADVRWFCSALLVLTHVSLISALVSTGMLMLWGVMLVSLILIGFLMRAGFVTRRLAIALDDKKHTPGLDLLIRDGL